MNHLLIWVCSFQVVNHYVCCRVITLQLLVHFTRYHMLHIQNTISEFFHANLILVFYPIIKIMTASSDINTYVTTFNHYIFFTITILIKAWGLFDILIFCQMNWLIKIVIHCEPLLMRSIRSALWLRKEIPFSSNWIQIYVVSFLHNYTVLTYIILHQFRTWWISHHAELRIFNPLMLKRIINHFWKIVFFPLVLKILYVTPKLYFFRAIMSQPQFRRWQLHIYRFFWPFCIWPCNHSLIITISIAWIHWIVRRFFCQLQGR